VALSAQLMFSEDGDSNDFQVEPFHGRGLRQASMRVLPRGDYWLLLDSTQPFEARGSIRRVDSEPLPESLSASREVSGNRPWVLEWNVDRPGAYRVEVTVSEDEAPWTPELEIIHPTGYVEAAALTADCGEEGDVCRTRRADVTLGEGTGILVVGAPRDVDANVELTVERQEPRR